MFPNPRRNEVGRGTLYRSNAVTPLSGDVLTDPEMEPGGARGDQRLAELLRLSGRNVAPAADPVLSGTMEKTNSLLGQWNGLIDQQEQANRDAPFTGTQFHGKNYEGPLDAETQAKLVAMRQPISNPGGEFDIDSPRMQNLKAAQERFPIKTPTVAADPALLESIKTKRLADAEAKSQRYLNMPTPEREQIDKQQQQQLERGKEINSQGKAIQDQNQKAKANLTNTAQAGRLTREQAASGFPISPLQATSAVDSGMFGIRNPIPGEPPRPQNVDPMSTPGFAANFPEQHKANLDAKTQSANATNVANAAVNQQRKEAADRHVQMAAMEIDRLEKEKATASADRRIQIDQQVAALRTTAATQANAIAAGTQNSMPTTSVSGSPAPVPSPAIAAPSPAAGAGLFPITPIGNTTATAPRSSSPPIDPGGFPVARTPEEIAVGAANFKPGFPNLAAADDWNDPEIRAATANDYRPSVPLDGKNFAHDRDRQFYHGREHAKRIIDEMRNDLQGQNLITGPDVGPIYNAQAYQYLKQKYGQRYGDDAVRWVLSRVANRPDWISNANSWNANIASPPPIQYSTEGGQF